MSMLGFAAAKPKQDEPANRRKPRRYMSQLPGPKHEEYPLEFCMWLQEWFDELAEELNTPLYRRWLQENKEALWPRSTIQK